MGRSKYIVIEYIAIAGMIVGGMNFLIHYKIGRSGIRSLFDDSETRYYFVIIGLFSLIVASEQLFSGNIDVVNESTNGSVLMMLESVFRNSLFQVISVMTTTGYGTVDIGSTYFGVAAKQIFLILMIIGGSTGSTSGGFKVLRIVILIRVFERELYKIFAPHHALTDIVLDGRIVDVEEIQRVAGLLFAWLLLLFLGGMVTAVLSNYSAWQSFSGMFSALGNIGPCYIPASEMGTLHPITKIIYIIGMLAGRLEIIPVILLFSPRSWK
jgi:trk system potassium uptake protein TrkH